MPVETWPAQFVEKGAEAPGDGPVGATTVTRTYAFVDLCRFTEFAATQGNSTAAAVISAFRTSIRDITARRGVRVAKWMGDGAMLVGVTPAPVVASAVELVSAPGDLGVQVRAAAATGEALLVEGDDYIGTAVNLAARMCDAIGPGLVMVDAATAEAAPPWVTMGPERVLRLKGMGRVGGLRLLGDVQDVRTGENSAQ